MIPLLLGSWEHYYRIQDIISAIMQIAIIL